MIPGLAASVFWSGAAFVAYTYLVYPIVIALLARLRRARAPAGGGAPRSVTIVIAAYNEEANIGRKLGELLVQCRSLGRPAEIVVVSDGSTDDTVARARACADPAVRVIALPVNGGKAVALNHGCAAASGEVIVFSDARQRWAEHTLRELVDAFESPDVGAVSGELVLEDVAGATSGVGLYWRYEKWIRLNESRFDSTVGVSGAVCAVRKRLYVPIPRGIVLDDVYWPLRVVMQGYRVLHRPEAVAVDRLPDSAAGEFRRKVRTLAGNFQLMAALPAALLPWRNRVWAQLLSHKLARLVVPWALLAMLVASAVPADPTFRLLLAAQLAFYGIAALHLLAPGHWPRSRLASVASSFVVLNAAAWIGFFMWASGQTATTWTKTNYVSGAAEDRGGV